MVDLPESGFAQPESPSLSALRAHPSRWEIALDGNLYACTWFGWDGGAWIHWLEDTGERPTPDDLVRDIQRLRFTL